MPTFISIGYGDEAGYRRTDATLRDRAHEHDEKLLAGGARIGPAGEPTQVRNTEGGGVQVERGPYMTSPLPVAGFTLVEADSLEHAIELVAKTPCAIAHGVVEVWPIAELGER
ncbi:YciI family protein [uncultured Agrococcus sp.]|uniref:YciI family protein n=1 Tax=uncultured Agrococcus sp. TaxID=382258 RepID=UPI0025DF9DDB|nr:YciI family protein [uncultured Agrococcus sp.]